MPDPDLEALQRGTRRRSGEPGVPDPWVQCNVRVRRSMLEMLDQRRTMLGQSRDEWMRNVVEWALLQPPGTPVRPRRKAPS